MPSTKPGPKRPVSEPATSGDVADAMPPRVRARSTDSATLQRADLPALTAFIEAKHAELASPEGDRLLAVRGDTTAARAVLGHFIEHAKAHRIGATAAETWPDLRATVDVLTLMLAQPTAATATALGFQGLRASRADRIVGLVVFHAVDHAQHAMGEFRTTEAACAMVASVSVRLVGTVFPRALRPDAVLKLFNRMKSDDPMGVPSLLQRARRMRDN